METIRKSASAVDGAKTYIGAGIGILVIVLNHFWGLSIPGVRIDDANWLAHVWALGMVMFGRHALQKAGAP
ncbi:MAG: hypothetical protein ACLPKB_24445 [Xanthobacteraceae bacterium]